MMYYMFLILERILISVALLGKVGVKVSFEFEKQEGVTISLHPQVRTFLVDSKLSSELEE